MWEKTGMGSAQRNPPSGAEAGVCVFRHRPRELGPLAGPTSPGPTSKNKSQESKLLVGSAGACCLGNPFLLAAPFGCWSLCQSPVLAPLPALCLSFWGGKSTQGTWGLQQSTVA